MTLIINKAGPLTTLQDLGRSGYLRYGVNQSGVMDTVAARLCWGLLEQTPGETPLIEVPLGGLQIQLACTASVAVVSTGFSVLHNGEPHGASVRLTLQAGDRLDIKAGASGQFAYLGLHADWAIAPVLGAFATHLRSGVGPSGALKAGDRFAITPRATLPERTKLPALDHGENTLRAVAGPQQDFFDEAAVAQFYDQAWTLDAASDRMASALRGDPLNHLKGFDILSDGIAFGAVQVPGSGQPFVLMADRGTTGGYPKIATVISSDLPRIAQARPGTVMRFNACTLEHANAARHAQTESMKAWLSATDTVDTQTLMSHNLISGVTDGT